MLNVWQTERKSACLNKEQKVQQTSELSANTSEIAQTNSVPYKK